MVDAAEAVIQRGMARFPNDPWILWQWALTATRRRDWQEAARRWAIAKQQHPHMQELDIGLGEMRIAMQFERVDTGVTTPPVAPMGSASAQSVPEPQGAAETTPERAELQRLLLRFESIGDNCEFGLVQRLAGIEPLGLLRWTGIGPRALLNYLNTRFEGVGEAEHTRLEVDGAGEYLLIDTRYFAMHTFVHRNTMNDQQFLEKMLGRLRYLKRKLIDDLTEGEKIFVFKNYHEQVTEPEIRELFGAIRGYGPGRLFWVQRPSGDARDGTVESLGDGLLVGQFAALTADPTAVRHRFETWVSLCARAEELAGG
jgi:hypothetical protein